MGRYEANWERALADNIGKNQTHINRSDPQRIKSGGGNPELSLCRP